jgi:2-polyprenyl-3-methyl-5-hydroxy-6-metoxy-1,4-benzoquinol methylase
MNAKQAVEVSAGCSTIASDPEDIHNRIRSYWNEHIHDREIARYPVGTEGFFEELADYRFEKLAYLPRIVNFAAYRGKRLLEVGCGIGTDLVRFAKHGAIVTGIDLAEVSIELARKNFALNGVSGDLQMMNGEHLQFDTGSFDVVYAHGVLQYTSGTERMIHEISRVLRPRGKAILMVYNRYSWLNLLSKLFGVKLEHEDAPVFKTYSISEFRKMLSGFTQVEIIPERFPVATRLHRGMKAALYNTMFVSAFNLIPKRLVRPFGWHLMAKAIR